MAMSAADATLPTLQGFASLYRHRKYVGPRKLGHAQSLARDGPYGARL